MRPASALTSNDVTGLLVGSAGIAIAWFASVTVLGESPILRQTLITVARCDIRFARTFAGHHVATLIVDGTQGITGAGCKSNWLYCTSFIVWVLRSYDQTFFIGVNRIWWSHKLVIIDIIFIIILISFREKLSVKDNQYSLINNRLFIAIKKYNKYLFKYYAKYWNGYVLYRAWLRLISSLDDNNYFFTLTSLGIIGIEVPEAVFTAIATTSVNIRFAMTASGLVAT